MVGKSEIASPEAFEELCLAMLKTMGMRETMVCNTSAQHLDPIARHNSSNASSYNPDHTTSHLTMPLCPHRSMLTGALWSAAVQRRIKGTTRILSAREVQQSRVI